MNIYFLIAGVLCIILGGVHSVLGEQLIFRTKRIRGDLVPSAGNEGLKERHLRIIWATWHLSTVFGWCLGAVLIAISFYQKELNSSLTDVFIYFASLSMFLGTLLVFIGTKGKHPGWIVLLAIGLLLLVGNV